jgi:hypothetical protein
MAGPTVSAALKAGMITETVGFSAIAADDSTAAE